MAPSTPRPSRAMSFQIGAVLIACVACEFPASPSKYTKAEHDASATQPGEQPSTTLVESFADGNSACARDLEQSCSSNLKRCAATPGCEDFAACVLGEATPAAPTTCGDLLDTTLEARWS